MTVPGAEDLLRELAPQVLGALVRRHGQFDGCEDAVQEALLAASAQWPAEGVPDNPRGWLVTVASRRLVDQVRSERARRERETATAAEAVPEDVPDTDDTLVLLFLCCHPALTAASQTALTLRAVGGLTTAEIARAFLVPEATMAVRISRAKQRIKAAGSSFSLPAGAEREERLQVVLHVLYLIFNEGYTASAGPDLHRADLAREAIRLTRMVARQLPGDGEVTGLLALMLLTHARRAARTTAAGDLVPLDEQDRTRWDHGLIDEGTELVKVSLAGPALGPYQLQAAIAATHASAANAAQTNWAQVHALYLILERIAPNPVVTLNRAIALAQTQGPQAGLDLLSALDGDGRVAGHHRLLSVRAHLLEQAGDPAAAYEHYRQAARSTASLAEQRYLESRASRLRSQAQPKESGSALDGGDAAVGPGPGEQPCHLIYLIKAVPLPHRAATHGPASPDLVAPWSRSQLRRASRPVSMPSATSRGVLSPHDGVPFRSAPRASRYSAIRRSPPWQACQKASVSCCCVGGEAASSSSARVIMPSAAACQSRPTRAPRSTSRRATRQQPYPTASSSGVPPAIDAPVASMSAPPSISALATSTSSLLAAQCSGVSACQLPSTGALGSAPAAIRTATTCGPRGKKPGQSAAMCNGVPEPPLSSTTRAEARPGCSPSSPVSDSTSPAWIASASAWASGALLGTLSPRSP
jgi:RNA polymerase sigma factor (sigma-70 family)